MNGHYLLRLDSCHSNNFPMNERDSMKGMFNAAALNGGTDFGPSGDGTQPPVPQPEPRPEQRR